MFSHLGTGPMASFPLSLPSLVPPEPGQPSWPLLPASDQAHLTSGLCLLHDARPSVGLVSALLLRQRWVSVVDPGVHRHLRFLLGAAVPSPSVRVAGCVREHQSSWRSFWW